MAGRVRESSGSYADLPPELTRHVGRFATTSSLAALRQTSRANRDALQAGEFDTRRCCDAPPTPREVAAWVNDHIAVPAARSVLDAIAANHADPLSAIRADSMYWAGAAGMSWFLARLDVADEDLEANYEGKSYDAVVITLTIKRFSAIDVARVVHRRRRRVVAARWRGDDDVRERAAELMDDIAEVLRAARVAVPELTAAGVVGESASTRFMPDARGHFTSDARGLNGAPLRRNHAPRDGVLFTPRLTYDVLRARRQCGVDARTMRDCALLRGVEFLSRVDEWGMSLLDDDDEAATRDAAPVGAIIRS